MYVFIFIRRVLRFNYLHHSTNYLTIFSLCAIFQGLLRSNKDYQNTKVAILRLWIHETYRVFYDRLIDEPLVLKSLKYYWHLWIIPSYIFIPMYFSVVFQWQVLVCKFVEWDARQAFWYDFQYCLSGETVPRVWGLHKPLQGLWRHLEPGHAEDLHRAPAGGVQLLRWRCENGSGTVQVRHWACGQDYSGYFTA